MTDRKRTLIIALACTVPMALAACGREEVSSSRKTTVNEDGTIKSEETKVTREPDGTVPKEETEETTEPPTKP